MEKTFEVGKYRKFVLSDYVKSGSVGVLMEKFLISITTTGFARIN